MKKFDINNLVVDQVKTLYMVYVKCPTCGFDNPSDEMLHQCPMCGDSLRVDLTPCVCESVSISDFN